MKRLLREPLVHFLLIGAALFVLDGWLRPAAPPQGGEIVVSEARIRSLAQNFRRTWQRPPTGEELDGLIQDHVREEVLYREALTLGLDRDDTIVRRRLRQKMEFMADETAALARPTDQQLRDYLTAHAEKFRSEPRATFTQVLLDAHGRPTAGLRLLDSRYENAARSEVARVFGSAFAEKLFEPKVAPWVGRIASGYGEHEVRVDAFAPGGIAALEDVRPFVEREWASARRKEVGDAFYARLREKYKVTIKTPETAAVGARQP